MGRLSLVVVALVAAGLCRRASAAAEAALPGAAAAAADPTAVAEYAKDVRPLLEAHCFDCHADGVTKGNVAFDEAGSDAALVANHELWGKVLKNVRAGLMPPPKKGHLPDAERQRLEQWIKYRAFALDPASPDPGRVTLRRLNRVEYRNTVRDLLGVDYRTDEEFPADDTGHGFDNIGDALTVSPLLLEKYLAAATQIIGQVVPTVPKVVAERYVSGGRFRPEGNNGDGSDGPQALSYYEPAKVTATVNIEHAGKYRVLLEMLINGKYAEVGFDYNKAQLAFAIDGAEVMRQDYGWEEKRELRFEYEREWQPGEHKFTVELKPLTGSDLQRYGELKVQLQGVKLQGPLDERHWVRPKDYERFFGKGDDAPADDAGRRARAAGLLREFATKAFRRPADDRTVERLTSLAESAYGMPGKTFESGVAHAMIAVLASPRFLFREEFTEPAKPGERFPRIDEYSLASRLSYFLWSSMPDEELVRLAAAGQLRANLPAQVKRMLADERSGRFIENFAGQWLQARDVEGVTIEPRRVADRDTLRKIKYGTDGDRRQMRAAMKQEVERYFDHVVREDRNLVELIESDYTFLNERLATFYGVPGVTGRDMRKVTLPPDSPRGGILTSGAVLMVTSNPTRTSPVKRGLFVLENFLGTPPPPAPPDIPSLEDATKKITDRQPTLRETLELHRASPACSSCHNRMDPIGLAFENFNALGMWREKEREQPINPAGKLVSGREFKDVRELKKILVTDYRRDFYACVTEKLLTYALGRGVEHSDVETVDQIVAKLERDGGRFSTLLAGVIDSAPFQQRRETHGPPSPVAASTESGPRTDAR